MKDDATMDEELQAIDAVQKGLGAAKEGLRQIQKMNQKAGRDLAANAAMIGRGKLIALHGELTVSLHEHYPDHASEVQTRGGGGR